MAVNNESLLLRLVPIIPVSVPKPDDMTPADKNDQGDSSLPVQGSPLVNLSSSSSARWQEISQFKPGRTRLILIPASVADAKLVQDETKPAIEVPAGEAALKDICQQLHEVTGYDAWVYEIPLTQNEGPVSPQEVEKFVSLIKIAESGTHYNSKFPLSYYIEEQSFDSEPSAQISGLSSLQSIARRAQALIKGGSISTNRGVNIFAVVGRPEPAATLNPTINPPNPVIEPGKWIPLGPVNPADIGRN